MQFIDINSIFLYIYTIGFYINRILKLISIKIDKSIDFITCMKCYYTINSVLTELQLTEEKENKININLYIIFNIHISKLKILILKSFILV